MFQYVCIKSIIGVAEGKMRVLNIRTVPEDLHSRFKAQCALENMSMTDKVVGLIREYVEKQEEKRKK